MISAPPVVNTLYCATAIPASYESISNILIAYILVFAIFVVIAKSFLYLNIFKRSKIFHQGL